MIGCEPCGMADVPGVGTFSHAWYVLHRERHLATFPDVDRRTRENLDALVDYAAEVRP